MSFYILGESASHVCGFLRLVTCADETIVFVTLPVITLAVLSRHPPVLWGADTLTAMTGTWKHTHTQGHQGVNERHTVLMQLKRHFDRQMMCYFLTPTLLCCSSRNKKTVDTESCKVFTQRFNGVSGIDGSESLGGTAPFFLLLLLLFITRKPIHPHFNLLSAAFSSPFKGQQQDNEALGDGGGK